MFTTRAQRLAAAGLRAADRHTRQSRAPGIDGVTANLSAEHLDDNRRDVYARLGRGRDQAGPVERVWIEQDDGGRRPIGKPAVADKMVQRAGAMRREAIDEQDFHDGSEGFRPGRRAHAAWHELRERGLQEGIGWMVAADVRGYFASGDRTRLQAVLRRRVNDGRIRRLIGKWRRAGVMEDGEWPHPEPGVVPGGVIAPVWAHICLHHGLDAGVERAVRPRMRGRGLLLRWADEFGMGGELDTDARKRMTVRPKRCARFGRTIHPTKTVWIAFRRPPARQASAAGNGTCDFLGVTHDGTPSRRGVWVSTRRPARTRLRRTQKARWRWCRIHRHAPLKDQYQRLCLKLRGHFRSDGIRGNCRLLEDVRRSAEQAWRSWLSRRSRKSPIGWEPFPRLLETSVLPTPTIVHDISAVLPGRTGMRQRGAEPLVTEEPYA